MDGLVDCQDPQCAGKTGCVDSCVPPYDAMVPGFSFGDTTGRPSEIAATCARNSSMACAPVPLTAW